LGAGDGAVAQQEPAEPEKVSASKVRKADTQKQINVAVAKMNGESVAKMSLQTSQLVQEVLDQVSAQTPFGDRIGHLTHQTTQLLPHQSIGKSGVQDGAVLTLTFEARPLLLRSVERSLTQAQARAEELRLQPELDRMDQAELDAAAKVEEREREKRKLQAELRKVQAKVRAADEACHDAHRLLHAARAARTNAAINLDRARQNRRTDFDRVVEQLKVVLGRVPLIHPQCVQHLGNIALDLHHLHLAGEVCDDQLASAAEAVAASSVFDGAKANYLYVFVENAGTPGTIKPGYLRVIETLLPPIVASEVIQSGT
jgi:signal transduction histidine kinase